MENHSQISVQTLIRLHGEHNYSDMKIIDCWFLRAQVQFKVAWIGVA